ncbi:RNA polymerase sigma factor [Eubacterium oxidoreducens]|uniref:RNA polymerase sigma-70 factor, ECF subfamily n=1 Tax=Eubacterium oxidoreducens TaxID=1732 RepID=A0A1G6CSD6_EUBOX|nr:RNA polymerase sigma factor [Eubacterium oxidoreducens]SDB35777.1 RNA polymerase sigma-70 factor, ECF subfamily [Eubacterium oxidoreducens]
MQRISIPPGIFEQIAMGDKAAFETLYNLTYKALFAVILSWTKNQENAKDILQETYIKIYKSSHLYKEQGNPMAWMITISRNLFLMKVRSEQTNPVDGAYELQDYDICVNQISDADNRILIEQLFEHLSDEERTIIVMHLITGLKHREIAAQLHIPVGTVLSKYNRAIKKLKSVADKKGGTI